MRGRYAASGCLRASVDLMTHGSVARSGSTLPELAVVLAVTAVMLAIAIPHARRAADRAAVRGAVAEIVATLSTARQMAVAHGDGTVVSIDPTTGTLRVLLQGDTVATRALGTTFGVAVQSTRDRLAYDGRGLAAGAANLTFVVQRGTTSDTVVVSRLGRVRW